MNKVNPKRGNETKSDIFPWDIFKSDIISFLYQKAFTYFIAFKIEFCPFYDYSEPKQ